MSDSKSRKNKNSNHNSKTTPEPSMTVFIEISNKAKKEANKLFRKKDYEGAIAKYRKAINYLPRRHPDATFLYYNVASCYTEIRPRKYDLAIKACTAALKVSPQNTKALIKRARCFGAIKKTDLVFRDIKLLLFLEPNNIWVLRISEGIKEFMELKPNNITVLTISERIKSMEENEIKMEEKEIVPVLSPSSAFLLKVLNSLD